VREQLRGVLEAAAGVSEALQTDGVESARDAFARLGRAIDAVAGTGLSEDARAAWQPLESLLEDDAFEGQRARDEQEVRRIAESLRTHAGQLRERFALEQAAPQAAAETEQPSETEEPVDRADPAAFRRQLADVWRNYVDLQTALAADDLAGAREALRVGRQALEAVDMGLLGHEEHMVWMQVMPDLRESIGAMSEADSIEELRAGFAPYSDALARALSEFGLPEAGPVYRLHCPMALGGAEADWLQPDRETRNPFFGAAMLGCGDVVETIRTAETGGGGEASDE
jgi:Cu(I)/Ag(I) efflux system membrane fusion protein